VDEEERVILKWNLKEMRLGAFTRFHWLNVIKLAGSLVIE
jgi:hypothetical protein